VHELDSDSDEDNDSGGQEQEPPVLLATWVIPGWGLSLCRCNQLLERRRQSLE
jgi:hypothetical protein